MDPYSWAKLIVFVVFLLLSAFFSSAETAFTAISRLKLRSLVEQKVKGAKQLQRILTQPKKLITAILIGNNLANVGASAMATAVIMDLLNKSGISNFATSMAIITSATTFIILTFGEITPKTLAIKNSEKWAIFISKPIYLILVIFHPLVSFFNIISLGISKMLGISSTDVGKILTAEEIKTIVKVGEEEGILDKEEIEMIHSIFEFSDTIVREIMTPRTDTICIDVNNSVSDAILLIQEKGHSRIPVFSEHIDNIQGLIYAKDLLGVSEHGLSSTLHKFMREAIFIPETKNVEALLHQMKKGKGHIAIVVDEYGGMSGLVTIEDMLEEIVGEIQDEYDPEAKPEFIEVNKNEYLVDAGMSIDDLAEKIDCAFPKEDDYDTIGGFVLSLLGKFPTKGEQFSFKNLHITVTEISKRRIHKLEIIKTEAENENIMVDKEASNQGSIL